MAVALTNAHACQPTNAVVVIHDYRGANRHTPGVVGVALERHLWDDAGVAQIAHGMLRDGADPAFATARALKMIGAEVQRQALVMSYIDGFWLMGIGIILAIPAVLFLQRPKPERGGSRAQPKSNQILWPQRDPALEAEHLGFFADIRRRVRRAARSCLAPHPLRRGCPSQ